MKKTTPKSGLELVAPEGFEPVTVLVLSETPPTSWAMGP